MFFRVTCSKYTQLQGCYWNTVADVVSVYGQIKPKWKMLNAIITKTINNTYQVLSCAIFHVEIIFFVDSMLKMFIVFHVFIRNIHLCIHLLHSMVKCINTKYIATELIKVNAQLKKQPEKPNHLFMYHMTEIYEIRDSRSSTYFSFQNVILNRAVFTCLAVCCLHFRSVFLLRS